jgi:hypothetical protein
MASTSYSPLPSNAYVALGSQGDLLHAANYGKKILRLVLILFLYRYI